MSFGSVARILTFDACGQGSRSRRSEEAKTLPDMFIAAVPRRTEWRMKHTKASMDGLKSTLSVLAPSDFILSSPSERAKGGGRAMEENLHGRS